MSKAQQGGESSEEVQRERYRELLEELRVVLPGVQVLFAFLLTAPFSARFSELDQVGRNWFAVSIVSAALSTLLLIAPSSYHRVAPRRRRRERIKVAVRLALAGMAALVVAVVSALFVVTRFIYGTGEGTAVAAVVLVAALLLWYVLPLLRRLQEA